jgi:hypothetical protein
VVEFLSQEWIEALDAAASSAAARRDLATAASTESTSTAPDGEIVIQQIVVEPSGHETAYHLVLADGVSVRPGRAASPTITFTTDRETAAAVSRGAQSAQAAFMTGRLRIAGDVQTLTAHQAAASDIDDLFAAVRATTTY